MDAPTLPASSGGTHPLLGVPGLPARAELPEVGTRVLVRRVPPLPDDLAGVPYLGEVVAVDALSVRVAQRDGLGEPWMLGPEDYEPVAPQRQRHAVRRAVPLVLVEEDAAVLLAFLVDRLEVLGEGDEPERCAVVSAAAQLRNGLRGNGLRGNGLRGRS